VPLRSASDIAPNRHAVHPFDAKYGTDTGGYLTPEEIASGREHDALNYGYSAIAPSVFRSAIGRWRDTLPGAAARQLGAYTFVDVGAGKGRALLLAAESPFRKVVGVELNENLARIARRNVAKWSALARPRAKLRVLQSDALEFRWPRTPLLVYLYNPFACELVEQLAARLAAASASASGLADLLYINPTCADVLSRHGSFTLLWTARIQMDEPDQQADPYGTSFDRVSAYRLRR